MIADMKYVWGDVFKIEEVLTNYISNADKSLRRQKRDCGILQKGG